MRFTVILLVVANVLLALAMGVVSSLRIGHSGPRTEFAADRIRLLAGEGTKPAPAAAPLNHSAEAEAENLVNALCLQWSDIPVAHAQEARDELALAIEGVSFRERPGPNDTITLTLEGVNATTAKALTRLKAQVPGTRVKAVLCESVVPQPKP